MSSETNNKLLFEDPQWKKERLLSTQLVINFFYGSDADRLQNAPVEWLL